MSIFAKRHYEAIAEIMHNNKPAMIDDLRRPWLRLCDDFATMFKRDNPQFQSRYFDEACENGLHTESGGYRKRANAA